VNREADRQSEFRAASQQGVLVPSVTLPTPLTPRVGGRKQELDKLLGVRWRSPNFPGRFNGSEKD
jgi:hypothetical protein